MRDSAIGQQRIPFCTVLFCFQPEACMQTNSSLLHQLLPRAAQDIALRTPATPSPEDLFGHQANVLLGLGLGMEQELDLAMEHLPRPGRPFLFVPEGRPLATAMEPLMKLGSTAYGAATSRVDLKHPVRNMGGGPT